LGKRSKGREGKWGEGELGVGGKNKKGRHRCKGKGVKREDGDREGWKIGEWALTHVHL